MDENGVDRSEFISDEDSSSNLISIILACLSESIRSCYLQADENMLDGKDLTVAQIDEKTNIGEYQSGSFDLPGNLLRILTFKMSDWIKAVSSPLYGQSSQEYAMQKNEFTCGTPERPVAFIIVGTEGKKKLEYYTCGKDAKVEKLVYVEEPIKIDPLDVPNEIEFSEKLYDSILNYTIYLVLGAYRDNRADFYLNVAKEGFK